MDKPGDARSDADEFIPPSGLVLFIATVLATVLLAGLAAGSGLAKVRRAPQVMRTLERLGAAEMTKLLAGLELAGAVGLLVGLIVVPLGVLSAICFVGYFIGAAFYHMRAGDPVAESGPAIAFGLLAIATAALRTASA